eukprot:scaffold98748_cov61-Phaeocystis_antarctica.AAC.1
MQCVQCTCSAHAVCAHRLRAGGGGVHEGLGTAGHASRQRRRPRALALRGGGGGGGGIRVAAGEGNTLGGAPRAIVSKRLRAFAARHPGVPGGVPPEVAGAVEVGRHGAARTEDELVVSAALPVHVRHVHHVLILGSVLEEWLGV